MLYFHNRILENNYLIASFAASIERFHEFCIKVLLKKSDLTEAHFEELWKTVKSQSERQLRAFLFLYLQGTKKLPPNFMQHKEYQEWSAFRNKIIHQGHFPTLDETMQWGEKIFIYLAEMIRILKEEYSDVLEQTLTQEIINIHSRFEDVRRSVSLFPTELNIRSPHIAPSFSDALSSIKRKKQREFII